MRGNTIPKTFALIATVLFLFSSQGCKKDKDDDNSNGMNPLTSYPVETGNYWEYDRLITFDGVNDTLFPDPVYNLHHVEVTGKVSFNDSLQPWEFSETIYQEGMNNQYGKAYFTNEEDGFYNHGYIPTNVAMPLKNSVNVLFGNKKYSSVPQLVNTVTGQYIPDKSGVNALSDSTIFYEIPPVKSLHFELKKGAEWTYRETSGAGKLNKKVVGTTILNAPAGVFNCYKIKLLYQNSTYENITVYYYVANIGLVKKEVFINDISFTDSEGNVIGTGDYEEILILTGYSVK